MAGASFQEFTCRTAASTAGKNADALAAPGAFHGLPLFQVEKPTVTLEQEVVPSWGPLPTAQPRTLGAEGLPSLPCSWSESIFH